MPSCVNCGRFVPREDARPTHRPPFVSCERCFLNAPFSRFQLSVSNALNSEPRVLSERISFLPAYHI